MILLKDLYCSRGYLELMIDHPVAWDVRLLLLRADLPSRIGSPLKMKRLTAIAAMVTVRHRLSFKR